MKYSLSLKQSLFATIVIASTFLILVFTYLQLTTQAETAAENQIRESHLSILLTKEILESKLKMTPVGQPPVDNLVAALKQLGSKEGLLRHGTILMAKDGTILYPKTSSNKNKEMDKKRIEEILLTYDLTGKWFRLLPSTEKKDALDVITPLYSPSGVAYFLKTTITLENLKTTFRKTYRSVVLIFLTVCAFSLFVAYRISKKIIRPIKDLSRLSEEIARGHLDREVVIESGDEIEELSKSFNQMTKQLRRMQSQAEDANPLTHLPGNNVISAEITKRLQVGAKVAVMHCDLDRFKIYNDLYGLRRGDEVIKMTAEVLKEAVKEKGTPEDLVAHEGGDDFIIVTTPTNLETIAQTIIEKFNGRVGNHYRGEDRVRGHILIKDRRAKDSATASFVELPLMSISLAAVRSDKHPFASYAEIATALVDIKKKAKSIRGSSFVVLN